MEESEEEIILETNNKSSDKEGEVMIDIEIVETDQRYDDEEEELMVEDDIVNEGENIENDSFIEEPLIEQQEEPYL